MVQDGNVKALLPIAVENYSISSKKTASILDTFSCVFQGIIPYGAQMLIALSAAVAAGISLSAFKVIPLMFYPYMLLIFALLYIFIDADKFRKSKDMTEVC